MPIAEVKSEVYIPWTKEHGAPTLAARYTGKGLRLEELLFYEIASDWYDGHRTRFSDDNGKTWSEWKHEAMVSSEKDGFSKEEYPFAICYDSVNDKSVRFLFQRYLIGDGAEALRKYWDTGIQTYFDHNLWQVSHDNGRTWGDIHQLEYEDEQGNPKKEMNPELNDLCANEMYGSYNAIFTTRGTVIYPSAAIPVKIIDRGKEELVEGVMCFIGKWDKDKNTYVWDTSEEVTVPHRISGRGLAEPAIAELKDGRLLLEMRGSTSSMEKEWQGKVESPGRRWISISEDVGYTWSEVTDMRYDTGEQFYSPSVFSMFLRHSRTGKLYWFGNITEEPPDGNLPRYPLYIAEVSEGETPAIKKDTLTVIDDYDPEKDSPDVQFSNFRLLENRETGEIELYMTRLGEDKANWLIASAYKYTITLL